MRKRKTNKDGAPPWLQHMRSITGLKEDTSNGSNPAVLALADQIAEIYPEMESYAAQFNDDEIAWCGVATGNCLANAGIRPPFGKTDTDKWMWADSFRTDPNMQELTAPVLGCIVVMPRSGGNHVTMYESTNSNGTINCRGGNQSNSINVTSFDTSGANYMWPKGYPLPEVDPEDRPVLEEGDRGNYVVSVQNSLGIYPADGDFGPITDAQVTAFQRACHLDADGVVGPNTWEALDDLDQRKAAGALPLDQDMVDAITQVAETSAIAKYNWRDRGVAPKGFTAGVACCFAYCVKLLEEEGDPLTGALAQKMRNSDTDALNYLRSEFQSAGLDNSRDSIDTMRHVFVLLLGLGPRESSGRFCQGRDTSVPVGYYGPPDTTTEAAFVQTSWDIAPASSLIPPLLPQFWANPNGFLPTFQKGVTLKASDLECYGDSDGVRYQFLAKFCPLLHALVSTVGFRYRRSHWGPIGRHEVEIRRDADAMLREVQTIMEGGTPEPGPEPEPSDAVVANVTIEPNGGAKVAVFGGAPPDAQTDPEVVPTITITVDPPGSAIINVSGSTTDE